MMSQSPVSVSRFIAIRGDQRSTTWKPQLRWLCISLDAIDRHVKSSNVPQKLLNVLDRMKRGLVRFQSKERKGDSTIVLDLEPTHVKSPLGLLALDKPQEAATSLIQNVEKNDQNRLDAIDRQVKSSEIPQELLNVLKEMKRDAARFLDLPHETETKAKKLTGHDGEKVSLIKLATWIEVPARDNRSHVFARWLSHHKRKLKMSTLASRSVNSSA
ncbi:hypothetical protein F2Q68_00031958 [Brassica cretica]|uniref:Uncharacterized protein n=1 Tax=Brassica cretica TaxID=69181 RepID=A0A8S9G5F3_BRACR|nr:hypothetical protein F2Q68_00031958 [Brassica cretica]